MGGGEYQLSFETFAHDEDVRGIAVISEDCFATSSRDKTVKLWRRAPASTSASSATGSEFGLDKTLVGHTSFVGPLAWIPGRQTGAGTGGGGDAGEGSSDAAGAGKGVLVSGGMDCLVLVWDLEAGEVAQRLAGHEQQVTGITATAAGDIATCSVDKTIRVWREGHCQQQLSGHESSVLCLAAAPNGLLFSGSGDCTIRCWDGSSCIKSVRAHSGAPFSPLPSFLLPVSPATTLPSPRLPPLSQSPLPTNRSPCPPPGLFFACPSPYSPFSSH
ncbi:unnamed protein product [Closterium sp. NIES-53]